MRFRAFLDLEIKKIFDNYPDPIRKKLLLLREWIFEVAESNTEIGHINETLKWGEPSYLTSNPKSGTSIRIGWKKNIPEKYMMFVNCKTSLIANFAAQFGDILEYQGNRAIIFDIKIDLNPLIIKDCIFQALTYHVKNRCYKF